MTTVIVFGPTGNIGSWAARTAKEQGAKVVLAMRDTNKTIRGIESKDGFERVQADLTQPDSVSAAVKQTGAKRAFIYAAHGSKDHMKSALEALKSAGIDFVVFLSSFTVAGKLEDIPPTEFISYLHARIEMSLEQVFGTENFVAVRPGGFATNLLRYVPEIATSTVGLYGAKFKQDNITPDDMGKVAGTILTSGPKDGQHHVYLYGPQILSYEDCINVIGRVLGKEIQQKSLTKEEAVEQQVGAGVPRPAAEHLVGMLGGMDFEVFLGHATYDEGVANVERYTGKPGKSFEEWVSENKDLFGA